MTVSEPLAEGIDVSGYPAVLDWLAVREAGKAFAFIKATESSTLLDHAFATHWTSSKAAGLLRGAYHTFRPQEDAVLQAQFFLAQLRDRGELPPVLAVESPPGTSSAQLAGGVRVWLSYVNANYARPLIYASPQLALASLIPDIDTCADLWVARWGSSCPNADNGWPSWTFWQYDPRAPVPGLQGTLNANANRFHGTLEQLRAYSAEHLSRARG